MFFSNQDIKGVDKSHKYQEYLYYSSTNILKKYVTNNLITNREVTEDDINCVELIYSPPVPYLEGYMAKHKPPIHNKIEKIISLPMIVKYHLDLALTMDFSTLMAIFSH